MSAHGSPSRFSSRHQWHGATASSLVHLGILGLAGLWLLPGIDDPPITLDTTWATVDDIDPIAIVPPANDLVTTAGGRSAGFDFLASGHLDGSLHVPREPRLPSLHAAMATVITPREFPALAAKVSQGIGHGRGDGVGQGTGFFGLKPSSTESVVFVVDGSRSMNHPHDSPSKTRYRRLKLELIRSIYEMQPTQSFHVIFFHREAVPMPATTLISAAPRQRDPYLRWIAEQSAGGSPTDPLPALELALTLRPDVICFLTDGEFDTRIKRRLNTLKQQQTAIHTFAFGESFAEATLKQLAIQNRGEYRFVP